MVAVTVKLWLSDGNPGCGSTKEKTFGVQEIQREPRVEEIPMLADCFSQDR